jgi:hypothetical protein
MDICSNKAYNKETALKEAVSLLQVFQLEVRSYRGLDIEQERITVINVSVLRMSPSPSLLCACKGHSQISS